MGFGLFSLPFSTGFSSPEVAVQPTSSLTTRLNLSYTINECLTGGNKN